MPIQVKCKQCGVTKNVIPARAKTFKFCSYKCRGEWRTENWKGESHPNWQEAERQKKCQGCDKGFTQGKTEAISSFSNRKFCSKSCADKFGFRYTGENHPNYKEDARRKNRGGSHKKWRDSVISRDNASCQHCGINGVEMHAHHIKSYADNPDLRFDVDNGVTLCFNCHWKEHSAQNANGVNSGEASALKGGGNPEPSQDGNILDGVTTRGRAFRRWTGNCDFCGSFISKASSDIKGKKNLYCNRSCASKGRIAIYGNIKKGSNSSTSALTERYDIV